MKNKKTYGWKRDRPDQRDLTFRPKLAHLFTPLPPKSNNPKTVPVYDQGELGSCTGNGWAFAFQYELVKQGLPSFPPSRLFIYYNERKEEGTIADDAGAEIRDGIKVIARYGVCEETIWPYDVTQFAVEPTQTAYNSAIKHLGLKYARVNQADHEIRATLFGGNPIVFGFNVYDSFESDAMAESGILDFPKENEEFIGGHCVVAVNYDDAFVMPDGTTKAMVECRNSWGDQWGRGGYFMMPMEFITDPGFASDLWTLSQVE